MADKESQPGIPPSPALGLAGRIARSFINSKLTPLMVVAAFLLGALSILKTPREEEPQIVVPMLDVFVQMPGASAEEVAQRVSLPMEKLLRDVPGVEYIYSISHPGVSMLVVRFYVGIKEEDAIVETYNKLYSNFDHIPPGVSQPIIKVRSIDDVPILALTLWGKDYDSYRLRRVAGELENSLKPLDGVSETNIIGGQPRQVRVVLDTQRLTAYGLTPLAIVEQLQNANSRGQAGSYARDNREFLVEAGTFFTTLDDLRQVVVGVHLGRPVYLRDVAEKLQDGPAEPDNYVLFANARGGAEQAAGEEYPAVTITFSKRKGTNATGISTRLLDKVNALRGHMLPNDLNVTVTRNYGETAKDKSDELLKHLLIATLSVTLLVALALGWRESGVVLLAVPVTLALTLAVFYLYGYTLNRVTLFALIFSIGILVDDAIVVVENIIRHLRSPENRSRSVTEVLVEAVDEVGNPTILATFAVICAVLPNAFVRGLAGPYMRPIPVGASAAMLFSLGVAFIVLPWAALRLLRKGAQADVHSGQANEGWITRLYRRMMIPLILSARRRWMFLGAIVALLLAALTLVPLKRVRLKMLPFDNKSEFQVIIDMPNGTPLEQTTGVAQELGQYLGSQPEVINYQIYAGTSGPYNFNGLVRHYFLRNQPDQADIQVNLLSRHDRKAQSHDIARRLRPELDRIAQPFGARIKIAEVPPGPPVLQTLVAEVYGPDYKGQIELAAQIKNIFQQTPGVVDVDWSVEDPQTKYDMKVDLEKAALHGISPADVTRTLQIGLGGTNAGLLHDPHSREDIPIEVRLARPDRSGIEDLGNLKLPTSSGGQIALQEATAIQQTTIDTSVYRKNLQPVVYVMGDVAGGEESPVYAIMKMSDAIDKLKLPDGYTVKQYKGTSMPESADRFSIKWDGEWHITVEVFRDLGLAFAAVLVLMYVLVVGWFRSLVTPLVIMAPIPLTLIGILPAHALMGWFFTATSMIGFIAGAGIIVRNAIILVDFIELRRSQGMSLEDAVVDAGAVRFRPMLLTAAAVVVGASVILFDPILQGLALSLMAGEVASTVLSRMAVPVLYYISKRGEYQAECSRLSPEEELVATFGEA
ncbi:efflux RND transporter permease subunit [Alloacidobacterium sp.]|uniref:efflux RND transporter permease subunit n=1 Tax=Alloacidobacterium sp. TaxID=2951999 RepID=UPI002D3F020A|nr:efflux RND transporter permease subunit [Alloacidobacterium sp.]HYK37294.1 efflux RND transporter permease subunit [Alloacidobacterium sp.]